ncbi:hypothetical protein PtB15_11B639 [Puccinia triticina]|nr:hypothetical protein PtB15_11B639 [Puccinia triticina]
MNTPSGQAAQILVEELRLRYRVRIDHLVLDVRTGVARSNGFLALSPNGEVPVLIDNNADYLNKSAAPFAVSGAGAIMLHLANQVDKSNLFYGAGDRDDSDVVSLMEYGLTNIAVPTDELIHFKRSADVGAPMLRDYWRARLLEGYEYLDKLLGGAAGGTPRIFCVGEGDGVYSLADMLIWPFVALGVRVLAGF